MNGYLSETDVDWRVLPEFRDYEPKDWALLYIEKYGGIDGAHHKDWVLDQVSRILNGSEINLKIARWENGESEFRIDVGESKRYHQWVKELKSGEDGPETYGYSEGIAP